MFVAIFRHHDRDPLSWAISAITRGPYVHAALYFPLWGQIVEAYWPRVRMRPLKPGEAAGIDFFRIPTLTRDGEARIAGYCKAAIANHEAYSIPNLFRFLAPARVFLGEGREGNGRYPTFCSQFVMEALLNGDGIRLQNAHSYEVDPVRLSWSPLLERAPSPV